MQDKQNPYIDVKHYVDKAKVARQHKALVKALKDTLHNKEAMADWLLPRATTKLPDIVFVANGGLSLPRLQHPLILLPSMKFLQRQAELPFLKEMYGALGLPTVEWPKGSTAVFEGQAELKWFFGGNLAVCGPGFRSSRASFKILDDIFEYVYGIHGLDPPRLLITPLISDDYYHLDVAMLEVDDSTCIVHRKSMSPASVAKMRASGLTVHVIDTKDTFCLNAVISNGTLITHRLTEEGLAAKLKNLSGCQRLVEVDTSEFEKSGGSVRCMTLTV
jgi:hypothetical protein